MTIKRSSAKAKARIAQNWVAQKISDLTGLSWGKDQPIRPREMGQSGVDVSLDREAQELFPFSVEAKWTEKWQVHEAIKQAMSNQKKDTDWLVILRRSRHPYVAILDAEVFFKLVELSNEEVK